MNLRMEDLPMYMQLLHLIHEKMLNALPSLSLVVIISVKVKSTKSCISLYKCQFTCMWLSYMQMENNVH